ncbi:hypothetical protein GGH12_004877 [Coemansia sp. RSA 1822]|nr:hypothetical protein LPJ76_003225 [Coemansia sp. RSA 638]KAJ2560350.1 hypothetical protein GGH12_004877 [Coemansia sp. RSA 1822]
MSAASEPIIISAKVVDEAVDVKTSSVADVAPTVGVLEQVRAILVTEPTAASLDVTLYEAPDAAKVPEPVVAASGLEQVTAVLVDDSANPSLDAGKQGTLSETNDSQVPDSTVDPADATIADKEPLRTQTANETPDTESIAVKEPVVDKALDAELVSIENSVADGIVNKELPNKSSSDNTTDIEPTLAKDPEVETDTVDDTADKAPLNALAVDAVPTAEPVSAKELPTVVDATDNTTDRYLTTETSIDAPATDDKHIHASTEELSAASNDKDVGELPAQQTTSKAVDTAAETAKAQPELTNTESGSRPNTSGDTTGGNGKATKDDQDVEEDVDETGSASDDDAESEVETPRVQVYGSTVSGNRTYKKQAKELFIMLEANEIDFEFICIAADEQAKKYVRRKALGNMTIPQIYVDGEFKGFFEDAFKANEIDELYEWLGLDEDPVDF